MLAFYSRISLNLIAATVVFLSASAALATAEFDRIEGSTLILKAVPGQATPSPIQTELYDLRYLGTLRPPADAPTVPPYFLLTAKPCKTCALDSGIYAVRPGGRTEPFVHPGKIIDPSSRSVALESRAFFGRCLYQSKNDLYVVFQKERVDRRAQMQPSVFVAEPGADHLQERLLERRLPRLQDTLKLVKAKQCQEIISRNRIGQGKELLTGLRRGELDDSDKNEAKLEASELTKENQTDRDFVSSEAKPTAQ